MVNFIFGGAGSGKTETVFSQINKILRETDKKVCLIVPEPYTVTVEREVARRFLPSDALRFEVTNFTRLADAVSRRIGGVSYTHLSKGAEMLLLWRALISVWPALSELNSQGGADPAELVPTVLSAKRELAFSGVSPEELASCADALGDSSLSRRASDLSLICAAAASVHESEFSEVEDTTLRLAERIAKSGYFDNTSVFIDAFYSLTGAQSVLVSQMIRASDDVSFTIPMSSRHADGIHLDGVKKYYESALSAAVRYADGKIVFTNLEGNYRAKSAELAALQAYLWDYDKDTAVTEGNLPSDKASVGIFSVSDRYEEARALSSHIKKLTENGARYSDIVVACADTAALRGICDSELRRHGIPVFISESERITASPAVRLILSLLKIPGRWRREDVISIVKTGLSPLNDELACTFESYTDVWDIRSRRTFTSEWSMNPDGYREEITERGRRTLLLANEARDALIPHIERFADVFEGGSASVKDICTAIVEFFENSGAYVKMCERADALEASGARDDAERERLVWREICSSLDTLVTLAGEANVSASVFATLFRYAISDADTGAIPTGVDVVTVVSAASLRADGVRHVIILGAVEGEFPAVPEDTGYFSDDDRARLEENGVLIGSPTATRSSEAMFRFYKAVCAASETLTVFVPKTSAGASASPSEAVTRMLTLLGRDEIPPYECEIYDKVSLDASLVQNDDPELLALREKLFGAFEKKEFTPASEFAVSPETARAIFKDHLRLTQSRIDTFVKCPMTYYLRYVLKLSEDRRAEIAAVDIGSFVHAVLEELLRHICASSTYPEGRELEEICDSIITAYLKRTCADVKDGRLSYLFIRLRRQVLVFAEAIVKEASQSRFETYATELPIGTHVGSTSEKSPPPVVFTLDDGSQVSLYGTIDRLDLYKTGGKTYIRVIDYKTGRTRFSYDDVKIGLNVQLLLYLFSAWRSDGSAFKKAVCEEGELAPAGALYFNLRPGDAVSDVPLSAEEAREITLNSMEKSGVVTDELNVLDAMDRGITGKYVPVSLNKDNTLKKSASIATLERFGELYRELEGTVGSIAAEMKRGVAAARPTLHHGSSPCTYCRMRSVCRREEKDEKDDGKEE